MTFPFLPISEKPSSSKFQNPQTSSLHLHRPPPHPPPTAAAHDHAARRTSRPFQLPPPPPTAFQLLSTMSTADRHPPPTRNSNAYPIRVLCSMNHEDLKQLI
ncbi:velvet complex subunit B-like isoform X2 [Alnus glutinosa]|uniref:velvet complex subunit B-like isoform X2 n=1 Tax=Alnus glutinosa TaxID=3517 RepID=UPI002D79BEE4|nr:velvet complex subunit B-like isoform X2 [Alnus glutinosa]